MISPKICHCIHPFFRKYAPVSTPSSYCIRYSVIKRYSVIVLYKMHIVHCSEKHNLLETRSAFVDFFERSQITWLILLNISRPTHSTFFFQARKTSREPSVNQVSVAFLRHSSKQQLHQAKLYQTHTATKMCDSFKPNLLFSACNMNFPIFTYSFIFPSLNLLLPSAELEFVQSRPQESDFRGKFAPSQNNIVMGSSH